MSASVQSFTKCDLEFPTQGLEHVVRPQHVHVGGTLAIVLPLALPDVPIGRVSGWLLDISFCLLPGSGLSYRKLVPKSQEMPTSFTVIVSHVFLSGNQAPPVETCKANSPSSPEGLLCAKPPH